MKTSTVPGMIFTVLFVLFIFWLAGLVLKIGFGLIGMIVSLIGGALGLLFSKSGITLLALALIGYVLWHRSEEKRMYGR